MPTMSGESESRNLLVVEDDPQIGRLLDAIFGFGGAGYNVRVARHLGEVREHLAQLALSGVISPDGSPSASRLPVILDVNFPAMGEDAESLGVSGDSVLMTPVAACRQAQLAARAILRATGGDAGFVLTTAGAYELDRGHFVASDESSVTLLEQRKPYDIDALQTAVARAAA